jgi:hypothetical protein
MNNQKNRETKMMKFIKLLMSFTIDLVVVLMGLLWFPSTIALIASGKIFLAILVVLLTFYIFGIYLED